MSLPTKSEISNAIEQGGSVHIPQLQGYLPEEGILGPKSFSGGFCIVFPFSSGHNKKALRIWHQEIDAIKDRYALLSQEFRNEKSTYLCNIEYVEGGLDVDGERVDGVVLDWIDGLSMKQYLKQILSTNRTDIESKINELSEKLLQMFLYFHDKGFSHGDLQHDNIIITEEGNVKVIDYDCFYTPSMSDSFYQTTVGYDGYQHPLRSKKRLISNEKSDYFSELIIYISLRALAKDTTLWKYVEDADFSFLFTAKDYQNLKNSVLFSELSSMDGEMPILLQILQEYLAADDINELEPFDVLLDRYTKEPVIKIFEVKEGSAVYKGSKAQLVWEVENASKVLIDGKPIGANERQMTFCIDKEHQFEIEVINGLKSIKGHCSVNVLSEPNISFKISKTKVRKKKGDSVILKWNVSQAKSARLISDKQELSNSLSGDFQAFPSATTTYVLEAIGLDGKKIFSKECKVFALDESDVRFDASKDYSYPGLPIQLQWNIKHAKSVELVGYGEQKKQGTMVVEPKQDTTYELRVCDSFGRKSYFKTIKMLPLPIIESLKIPMPDIQSALNINLVQHPISFNISLPRLPKIIVERSLHLSKVELPITLENKRLKPIVNIKKLVINALIQISIWKIRILQCIMKK